MNTACNIGALIRRSAVLCDEASLDRDTRSADNDCDEISGLFGDTQGESEVVQPTRISLK